MTSDIIDNSQTKLVEALKEELSVFQIRKNDAFVQQKLFFAAEY